MLSGVTSNQNESMFGILSANPSSSMTGRISGQSELFGIVSVSVKDVPYYETDNDSGGITVYIGSEVVDNGV